MAPSKLKTMLKRFGFKISRVFYKEGSIGKYKNRSYRFRWWGDPYTDDKEFVVDVSCPNNDFDRWANSTDYTISFNAWIASMK